MARSHAKSQSAQSNKSNANNGKKRAQSPAEKASRKRGSAQPNPSTSNKTPLLDERTKRDIWGIVFCILAIAILILVAFPSSALVSHAAEQFLRYAFGIGAFFLPVFLLAEGICVVAKVDHERIPLRVAIGFTLIFLSILGIMSALTPLSYGDVNVPTTLFSSTVLISRGGYVGAGIAWLGLKFLGLAVTMVILIGVIAIGLAIVGLSLTRFIETLRQKNEEKKERALVEEQEKSVRKPNPLRSFAFTKKANKAVEKSKVAAAPTQALQVNETPAAPKEKQTLGEKLNKVRSHDASATTDRQSAITRKLGKTESGSSTSAVPAPGKTQKLANVPSREVEDENGFKLPAMRMVKVSPKTKRTKAFEQELEDTAQRLQITLADFGINATVVDWVAGPTVTLFKVDLPAGVRVSRVVSLSDDIALALAALGVRIFAPIPGTPYVGIEVSNKTRESVLLGDVLKNAKGGPLEMAIGKDVEGHSVVCDLAAMPHILIGGTTGSGKSIGINSMIMSILMRSTPSEVRFIMIDPKRVEFTPYNGLPHLYVPVVTEPKEAASALSWACAEMERRLKIFSGVAARNINEYNAKIDRRELGEEVTEKMPYIVIVIDELADLMMNVGKEVEYSISRLAQLARAAGIHLIIATQRPSANVVTGLIKANITNRMSYNVASALDSRVILDQGGAESLIGKGDLLLSRPEFPKPLRIQGCYVSPDEIENVVDFLKNQGEPDYHTDILKTNLIKLGDTEPDGSGGSSSADDELLWDAAELVCSTGVGSTSNIQRKLRVGYSRAGRIMDMLEDKGIVGPQNGSKPREVYLDSLELESLKALELNDE